MSRKQIREQIFKLLFRIEFNAPDDMKEQLDLHLESISDISADEKEEIIAKYHKIVEKKEEIDLEIDARATSWSIARLGKVELAILRLATYEIKFDDSVPVSVAINEAVELAKKFGQDESSSFINGVLANVAKSADVQIQVTKGKP